MILKSIFLKNFRLYKEAEFQFTPDVNQIIGPNAYGKTTVLEAVNLLMTGRSFRTSQLSDMINKDESAFFIEGTFIKHGIEQTIRFSYDGKDRKILFNQTPCASITGLFGVLQGTIMIPDDVALIKGSPKERRRFLDLHLVQIDPLYVHHLTRYHRAMRHRNILLRNRNTSTIETWEIEMAKSAAYIYGARSDAVNDLQTACLPVQDVLSEGREKISLVYKANSNPGCDDTMNHYLAQYHRMRERELQFGVTQVGPHRDDLSISIDDQEARYFASEGQQRSCVTSLRFAEWERLHQLAEDPPLMLIDDIGVSLDMTRRRKMVDLLDRFHQVVLTSTTPLECGGSASALITRRLDADISQ